MKTPPGFFTEKELSKRVNQKQIAYIMRGMASRDEEEIHPALKKLFKIEEKEVS